MLFIGVTGDIGVQMTSQDHHDIIEQVPLMPRQSYLTKFLFDC